MDHSDFSEAVTTSEYGSVDQPSEHYRAIPFVSTQCDVGCGYSGPFIQYSPGDILAIVQVGWMNDPIKNHSQVSTIPFSPYCRSLLFYELALTRRE